MICCFQLCMNYTRKTMKFIPMKLADFQPSCVLNYDSAYFSDFILRYAGPLLLLLVFIFFIIFVNIFIVFVFREFMFLLYGIYCLNFFF